MYVTRGVMTSKFSGASVAQGASRPPGDALCSNALQTSRPNRGSSDAMHNHIISATQADGASRLQRQTQPVPYRPA